ncbi:MAG TPA: type II secretion system F family protein [Clostridia bacterium]|nr:type II secretion system F family protein [Clostridia bacterium]HPQ46319.1 type II secretion system F family protein [Clostridia bacterium]HRX41592.1 type II secretion system F family protein [Clostridia bacterium]
MPIYKYKCKARNNEVVLGKISATSPVSAMERLRKMNFIVEELKISRFDGLERFLRNERPVKIGDLSLFSRQLASMIGAGIPVTRAISTIARQTKNPSFRKALDNIASNVESGMNLTDSFSGYPHIFDDLYVRLIESGELGGMLEGSLLRISEQLQKDKRLKDSIKSATFYPKMVLGFAVLIMFGMLLFLVPTFKGMASNNAEIPGITQVVFNLSDSLRAHWYWYIVGIIAIFSGIKIFISSRAGKLLWDKFKPKVPVFGKIVQKTTYARFSRTFSILLDGGIPVIQAMQSAGDTAGSTDVANKIREASLNVEQGNKISDELDRQDIFPGTVIHMIAVGEETGQLPELLDRVAGFYEEEVETLSKTLSSVIEPLMLVVVGLLVGGILISLYLPIFTAVSSNM